jgi:hypothetical protein
MSGLNVRSRGRQAVAVQGSDEPRYDHRLRGDDVALDFPSMVAVTERIRAGLMREAPAARLPLRMRLSADDARRGVSVPLDVPVCYTCRPCGGRGESSGEPCQACDSSGAQLSVERLVVRVPPGVVDGTAFRFSVTPRHHPTTRIALTVRVEGSGHASAQGPAV